MLADNANVEVLWVNTLGKGYITNKVILKQTDCYKCQFWLVHKKAVP